MISPQGYKLGEAPESKNPFWGEGEDSNVNKIYATATVDEGTGVPSVTTSKTVSGSDITFGFDFHNLKGERGPQGPAGATGATGPAGPAGADGAPGATGATGPQGPEGPKGDTGATGPAGPQGEAGPAGADGVSPTARVEQTGDNQATIYVTDANGTTQAVLTGEAGPQGPEGPQGQAGPKGDTGERGPIGPEGPVGPKGDTGAQGAEGPQGPIGETGPKGDPGATGPAGPGVPVGGTAGQVLTKKSGTDYDTEWKDAGSGNEEQVLIIDNAYTKSHYNIDIDAKQGTYYLEKISNSSNCSIFSLYGEKKSSPKNWIEVLASEINNLKNSGHDILRITLNGRWSAGSSLSSGQGWNLYECECSSFNAIRAFPDSPDISYMSCIVSFPFGTGAIIPAYLSPQGKNVTIKIYYK